MRAPIDDARVQRWISEIRALAFATIAALVGAIAAHGFWWLLTPEYARESHPEKGILFATAGALSTGVLARWVALRDERPIWSKVSPAALAGALAPPAVWLVLALGGSIASRSLEPLLRGVVLSFLVAVFASPFGISCGYLFGAALGPLRRALERIGRVPTITTMPNAFRATAIWSACGLVVVIALGGWLHAARVIAFALLVTCAVVAGGAAWVVHRRRALAIRAGRGELAGWRVERDDDGTRWLVREERGGEGAYREGVMSRRWARIEG